MSTTVWPPLPPDELRKEEEASLARELAWLLESLQETLTTLKTGLKECYALLAPIEPGSTLVVSSPRSECIKGHVTRIGTRIVKGSLTLRPQTHHPLQFTLNPDNPLVFAPLVTLRNFLNQSLDCIDITRWTGDRHSATFISSQLRLLYSLINEARSTLKGAPLNSPNESWTTDHLSSATFSPPLPQSIALDLTIQEASLVLVLRTLEPADAVPDIRSRLAFAIGAQRRLEHDEADQVFTVMGREVRVREKVRVESADPNMIAAMAKLGALEHTVGMARKCLSIVMGEEMEDS